MARDQCTEQYVAPVRAQKVLLRSLRAEDEMEAALTVAGNGVRVNSQRLDRICETTMASVEAMAFLDHFESGQAIEIREPEATLGIVDTHRTTPSDILRSSPASRRALPQL
jgi:hypothetical protein